eukprot:1147980-Pelagomonas_calceolata.AAC.1
MPWEVNGIDAGTAKQVGPLSFVRVAKAGHMFRHFKSGDLQVDPFQHLPACVEHATPARAHPRTHTCASRNCRVPMDQPLNALAMITSWTRNQTLARAHHITPLEGEYRRALNQGSEQTELLHETVRCHAALFEH